MKNLGKRSVLGAGLLGFLLMLSACASSGFKAEVSQFHQLGAPANPAGEGLIIVPAEGIDGGLEFTNYAGMIGARLDVLGYHAAADAEPEIVVTLGYAALPDPGYRPRSGPTIGIGFGGYGSNVGGSVGTTVDLSDNSTMYHRHFLTLVIDDAKTGERLYEGRASGHAKGANMPGVMPLLIEALFRDWPGISGATTTVKLETQ